jgi:chemotaxis response regulator CheB
MPVDPNRFIAALTADLEPGDASALAVELARMIDLGVLEIDDTEVGDPRISIAPSNYRRRMQIRSLTALKIFDISAEGRHESVPPPASPHG